MGGYSVDRIGRRAVVKENSKINEVMTTELNDIVFLENLGAGHEAEMQEKAKYYISIGQTYAFLTSDKMPYFESKNSFGTCFEEIR
jgi:hypothetical protein